MKNVKVKFGNDNVGIHLLVSSFKRSALSVKRSALSVRRFLPPLAGFSGQERWALSVYCLFSTAP
jgi:hypothetical protein